MCGVTRAGLLQFTQGQTGVQQVIYSHTDELWDWSAGEASGVPTNERRQGRGVDPALKVRSLAVRVPISKLLRPNDNSPQDLKQSPSGRPYCRFLHLGAAPIGVVR